MHSPHDAARLALLYRTAHNNHHVDANSLLEDFECNRNEVSLAAMHASSTLLRLDWQILSVLDHPERIADMAEHLVGEDEPLRAEALMHASLDFIPRRDKAWSAPFAGSRWGRVAVAMRVLEDEGFTATRRDVEALAVAVYKAVTGKTFDDYLDEYEDTLYPGLR